MELLELAERGPLRLADGLAGRLDLTQVFHQRRALFFLRLTRRGGAAGAAGFASLGEGAPSWLFGSDFGAVRDERFGGGCGFGISCLVTIPWPTVHRFVVTQ